MMDSQDKALEQGKLEEVGNMAEAVENAESQVETTTEANNTTEETPKPAYSSKKEVLARLKEIAHGEETPEKNEVEQLKTIFYKLHFAEREAQQKAYIDNGGDPEKYQVMPDEDEEAFKAEMTIVKERRQKAFMELEAEKQENLKKKLDIIERSRLWPQRRRRLTSLTRNSKPFSSNGRRLRMFRQTKQMSYGATISFTWSSSTTC